MTDRLRTTGAPADATTQFTQFFANALQALTWRDVILTFLFCLLGSGVEVAPSTWNLSSIPRSPALNSFLSMQFNGFAVMLCVLAADRVSTASHRRWWPYVLAVVVGVAIGTTLFWFVSQRVFFIPSGLQLAGKPDGFDSIVFRHAPSRLVICGLATYVYISYRFANQRLAALRVAQLERTAAERRVLESRLMAMQARVEPEFLFDMLAKVEQLYDSDAPAADRVLKELTAYLRAAIPGTGDTASTVAREIRLANTFFNITGLRSRDKLVTTSDRDSIQNRARMPPMVLLPLVKHALKDRVERADDDEWFEVDVVLKNDTLRLAIRDTGAGFATERANEKSIQEIRGRLAAVYGEHARLTLSEVAGGTQALLEFPYAAEESRSGMTPDASSNDC